MAELTEQELAAIATRNQCCLFVSNVMHNAYDSVIESVIREDVPTLLAEVRRLRAIESAAARVNDVWHGYDEEEKFRAWRALNIALHVESAAQRD